jgi:hypothetical protein
LKSTTLKRIQFVEQSYYLTLLMTFLVSGVMLSRSRAKLPLIPILFFLGSFAAYLLLEVQYRYHYPMIIFLITITGLWATRTRRNADALSSGDESPNLADGDEHDRKELAVSQARSGL